MARAVVPVLAALLLAALPASAQEATTPPPPPAPELGPTQPTPLVRREIDGAKLELDRADDLLLQGQSEAARDRLQAAEDRLRSLHEAHASEVPQGYVPLLVVEERLAALRQQAGQP